MLNEKSHQGFHIYRAQKYDQRNKMEVLAARELYFLKCSLHARPGFIPPRTRKIIVVLARTLANAHANFQPYLFKYVNSARNPPQ